MPRGLSSQRVAGDSESVRAALSTWLCFLEFRSGSQYFAVVSSILTVFFLFGGCSSSNSWWLFASRCGSFHVAVALALALWVSAFRSGSLFFAAALCISQWKLAFHIGPFHFAAVLYILLGAQRANVVLSAWRVAAVRRISQCFLGYCCGS